MKRYIYILLLLLLSLPTMGSRQVGVPFFTNVSARQYNAHNRNFDILCDRHGHTFVANFEGLLVYDNVKWHTVHTPGISRVTRVRMQPDGKVWFSGINVKGYVESVDGDSIRVVYVKSDKNVTTAMQEMFSDGSADVDRWNDIEVYQRLRVSDTRTLLATATAGVIAIDEDGHKVWQLNVGNGLCSNSITRLAYDGMGTVWGATDNGLFHLALSEIYTHYGEHEGLHGQVTSISRGGDILFVGTLQGLFRLEGDRFVRIEAVDQACWQLAETVRRNAIASTSNGVFTYGHSAHRLTDKPSLCVLVEGDSCYVSGELDGIYRRWYDSPREQLIDPVPYAVKLRRDKRGGIWALTLHGKYHYLAPGDDHFRQQKEGPLSMLFEYTDDRGLYWHSAKDGKGLVCDGMPPQMAVWIHPFSEYNIQAMLVDNGIAWIGGNFGLIRIDLSLCEGQRPVSPQVHIRSFRQDGRNLAVTVSNDKTDFTGTVLYSHRLHNDDAWSAWDNDPSIDFHNQPYGRYQLSVRSIDTFGQVSESEEIDFRIPYPVYLRWYALLLYVLLLSSGLQAVFRYRTRQLKKRQLHLERLVGERTQSLETTLSQLRHAQHQLVRKEREATVGKLTQGLIDRILNPMNYINNFSHLTIGLVKDLAEDLEDEKERMSTASYEDSTDLLGMMKTNLEKIEQHGLSTTRILKAMEEMLKERSDKVEPVDLTQLCQQNIEMLDTYYGQDIKDLGIRTEWEKPGQPILVEANANLLNKTIMSMLANSMFAIRKKAEKQPATYTPTLRLSIVTPNEKGKPALQIYDNGIGIEPSIIQKVFDPFFTTKPTAEAPGVGLYLCQQIIQGYGGNISVESQKDQYTQFTINF